MGSEEVVPVFKTLWRRLPVHKIWLPKEDGPQDGSSELLRADPEAEAHSQGVQPPGVLTAHMGYRRMGALQQELWENRIPGAICAMHPTPARQHKSVCSHQVLQQRPSRGQEALQPGALSSTVENRTLVTVLRQLWQWHAGSPSPVPNQ